MDDKDDDKDDGIDDDIEDDAGDDCGAIVLASSFNLDAAAVCCRNNAVAGTNVLASFSLFVYANVV